MQELKTTRKGFFHRPKIPKVYPLYPPKHCICCGTPLPPKKRLYCSYDCGDEYRLETAKFETVSWADVRFEVIDRDKKICNDCHKEFYESELQVHHKNPIYKGGDEFDIDNLITLCEQCHKDRHHKRGFEGDYKRLEDFEQGG